MKNKLIRSFLKNTVLFWLLVCSYTFGYCQNEILPGAAQGARYLNSLKNKKVGVVAHQASILFSESKKLHLVDYLLENQVDIQSVFAPEHGFRGTADAGEKVKNQTDPKTGLPIFSLYGQNRKPQPEQLEGIEVMVFDLQDVGVRFYTYLSTLHYIMEACAEMAIPLLVLDRPNPNIHYVDGPVLEEEHRSFVGMHPVPIVYGMTIGEYAKMINGEKWLEGNLQCDLTVIPLENYNRTTSYSLPVRPSPNLPNAQSVALYPSLCLLEPTVVSVGRGTDLQFQIYGHPLLPKKTFSFTPQPNFGSKNPKHKGVVCFGEDLSQTPKPQKIELKWLMSAYNEFPKSASFFLKGFDRIAGNSALKEQLEAGLDEKTIRASWVTKLKAFKKIRKNYLIYP